MRDKSLLIVTGFAVTLACSVPATAQQPSDPLTRFLDGFFKRDAARPSASIEQATPPVRHQQQAAPEASALQPPVRMKPQAASRPSPTLVPRQSPRAERDAAASKPAIAERSPAMQPVARPKRAIAEQPKSDAPLKPAEPAAIDAPKPNIAVVRTSAPSTAAVSSVPSSPAAALDRINAHFNSIDQLTAYFVQTSTNGQRAEGNLAMKRPGQLHFAYAPPSSLEIVSDGRSVAVRDKKLGTNDVYSVRQTPLKFLVQDRVDLAKDTKVQDVQIGSDGIVTVRFEDSATLGGTSKITLRFDARANVLKQWTVIDAQGYETTVVLSNLNVVKRASADAAN